MLVRRNGKNVARLGMAISKKNGGNSDRRNRIKRAVRESFRAHGYSLRGLDLVVIARSGLLSAAPRSLTKALAGHWQEIQKRCGHHC